MDTIYDLRKSENAGDLVFNHRLVMEYYEDFNNNRELNHNFVRGNQYEPNELKKYRDKNKTPVVFNQVKTSERTILGSWINQKYDVKFTANSPDDDDISEILNQLEIWESNQQGDDYIDIDLVRQAWAGGNSFQECYMDVRKGKEPQMYTRNQNPFAVYWDPESRLLITREDARFVDRDSWMSYPDLLSKFGKKMGDNGQLSAIDRTVAGYDEVVVYADRDHEDRIERNGVFLVTERFYKVDGWLYYSMIGDKRVEIDDEDMKHFKMQYPNAKIEKESAEELWLAIVCDAWSNTEYIFNGKYHCQPRDPRTKKIMWTIVEMVAENLAGEPQSFVDHERSANKIINALMSNILSSATHSAASAMFIDPSAFVSEAEAKLAARHHSDSDRSFKVKPGRALDAMGTVPKGGTNQDHQYALNFAMSFVKEISSTPPATQGQQESSSTPASLNAQRIEQGFQQLQPFFKNYRVFEKQRAKLRYYYWRTYYTEEKTFKIVDKSNSDMNPFVTINKLEPEMDDMGFWTGGFQKMNDINTAIYDITIEESVNSPTYRTKQLGFIEKLMNSPFVANDPGLAAGLLEESLRLSDAPQKTRQFIKKHSAIIQQAYTTQMQLENQMKGRQVEGQQLENQAMMQDVAQTEAQQTVGQIPSPSGAR